LESNEVLPPTADPWVTRALSHPALQASLFIPFICFTALGAYQAGSENSTKYH
jgi:hypothetical protein